MSLVTEFLVEAGAGLVGVFAGVLLALWAERSRGRRQEARDRAQADQVLQEARRTILTSTVKNTSEAKRMAAQIPRPQDPYLFKVSFELTAWQAAQSEFLRFADLDQRVVFARFFDRVHRLSTLVEFYRHVRSEIELHRGGADAGDLDLVKRIEGRLRELSEDVHLDGLVLITDYGEAVHQRVLGIKPVPGQKAS